MTQFLMPSLGADMEDGTLVEQLVGPGDPVHRGDIIAAVETQKGAIEIEVFEEGVLDQWLVPLGTKVPVGTPIAEIRSAGEPEKPDMPQPADPAPAPPPQEAPQPADPDMPPPMPEDPGPTPAPPAAPPPELASGARQRVSPAARRRAARSGFDLTRLGADRIISLADIPDDVVAPSAEPLSAMRQAIAAAMTRSKREIPHYYLSDSVDLTRAEDFIATYNADKAPDARLALSVLYVRALAKAAQKHPDFNGHFEDGRFNPGQAVHVGMAINLRGGGLVAPALHDATDGEIAQLMDRLRDLVQRVREGRFRARELSDPTVTLSSLGDRGVSGITGVIFPPQVAIVGIGSPSLQPAVVGDSVQPRRLAQITLAADHRVSDGHNGAKFLRAIIKNLQHPEQL
ncbi:dihydrolipoamide acetyltransferase family protein [Cognatiyoonia sp. IB215182]|uniref:dihydrolipoamide acetyltransferase family protein n=1 Tax=Cognatiyoonia sp. IB215182 TaxID=3097353 RepID=UPI002A0C96BE|nr:dihydrolipoamide acetyltransferase family protein [Cognatiyoonia sp. IB215182]MDX8354941.1 dihydrolipoamide acetyltransferase family protein [Cognatiyoonia sp. IB215182]